MAQTITSSTFTTTYKDDFKDSAGFYRILFNSGVALQARELTQLQTIIDKQIERMGNNLFVDGAAIEKGGQSTYNVEYIALQDLTNFPLPVDGDGNLDKSAIVGVNFTGQSSNRSFDVDDVIEGFTENNVTYPAALYITYTNTDSGTGSDQVPPRVSAGEVVRANDGSGREFKVANESGVVNHVGFGNKFAVGASLHYAKGFFVYSGAQEFFVNHFSQIPTEEIGFKVVEDVVTVADDTSLYDNQGTAPNLTAPGADRYRIRLILTKRSSLNAGESFIYLANITSGVITAQVSEFNAYKIPRDLIAQRIKENSGDYVVSPHVVQFLPDSSSDTHLKLKHSDGIVVIDGYRAQTLTQGFIRVPKATSTRTRNDDVIAPGYGSYVEVLESSTSGLPDISTFAELTLKTGSGWTGSSIGTARVRSVQFDAASNYYRFYLFDIDVNVGSDFGDVGSIGTSTSSYFDLRQTGGKAQLLGTFNNTLFVSLPEKRVSSISDVDVTVQRKITVTNSGAAGTFQATSTNLPGANEVYSDIDLWYWSYPDSSINQITGTFSGGAGGLTRQVDLTLTAQGSANGDNATVYAYVRDANAKSRAKTLVERVITTSSLDSDNGLKYINLKRSDVYSIEAVTDADDSSRNLRTNFVFDTGQRDNRYALGRLILKGGVSDPTASNPVTVRYKYFTHGNGKFFSKASYDNAATGFTYADIPNYRTADGLEFNLRDVLDFRSAEDSTGNFDVQNYSATVNELPRVGDTIEIGTASYFSPRRDRLIIDKSGVITYMKGAAGTGKAPSVPEGAMSLYEFRLNPNTLDGNDLAIIKNEHKRFTMRDIARLEQRVDKIEEFTTLTLLETDTLNYSVLDDSGNDRLKSGVLADNFSSHLLSDVDAPNNQFAASIDHKLGHLHPSVASRNVRLVYDSDNSVNTRRMGDMVYIDYDEEVYLSQTDVSKDTFINEFEVRSFIGNIELSPSSDTWYDYKRQPRKIINMGATLDTTDAYNWNHFEYDWNGTPLENLQVGDTNTTFEITYVGKKAHKSYNKVSSREVVEEFIEDKVIERQTIHTMRSNKVFFRATALRPNTKYFAFFNGVDVNNFVREETFQNYGDTDADYSTGYFSITQHPEGKTELVSDAEGKIEGSFFIPSTADVRFATGTATFKLLDVSVDNGNALSQAQTTYTALGEILTMQEEWSSTEVVDIDGVTTVITNANVSSRAGISNDDNPIRSPSAGWHDYNGGFHVDDFGNITTMDELNEIQDLVEGLDIASALNAAGQSPTGLTAASLATAAERQAAAARKAAISYGIIQNNDNDNNHGSSPDGMNSTNDEGWDNSPF